MTPEMTESDIEARVAAAFGNTRPGPTGTSEINDEKAAPDMQPIPEEPDNAETEVPSAPAIEIDSPETREEVAARLRQADYTRKTQALAAERKAMEAERQRIAAERTRYQQQQEELAQLAQVLESDPDLRERVAERWTARAPRTAQNGPSEAQIERMVQAHLDNALRPMREEAFVNRFEAEIRATAAEFGVKPDDVLKDADALIADGRIDYTTPVDLAGELLRGRVARSRYKTARAEGEREVVTQIEKQSRAPSVRPTTRVPKEPDPDVTKMGENEFKDFLKRKMREERT